MMNCPDKRQLEQYAAGKLDQQEMIELDEHVQSCTGCKIALCDITSMKIAGINLGASLLSLDCPEYEELSAYVDEQLDTNKAAFVRSHINSCEPCFNDVQHMQELRSHAALREKIVIRPRANQRPAYGLRVWKRAFAGALGAAVIAGLAVGIGSFTKPAVPTVVAVNKSAAHTANSDGTEKPFMVKPNGAKPSASEPEKASSKPENKTIAVLKDGKYQVIKQNGRLILTDPQGARTSLEAKIAASIQEKLSSGSIKQAKPVQMAMAAVRMRDGESYKTPNNAPKLISPIGKIILSVQPQLLWSKVELADSYRVRVFDSTGHLVIEKITSNCNFFTNVLQRGKQYMWRVGVRFNESDDWVESAPAKFHVVSSEDYFSIQNIKKNLPGSHLLLGTAYESCGLYDEARQEYRALRRDNRSSLLAAKLLHNTK